MNIRQYPIEDQIWGFPELRHRWGALLLGDTRAAGYKVWSNKGKTSACHVKVGQGRFCEKCGAWKGSFGLEPIVALYIEHSILIMREIRRVLKPDGILWWNIGDCYASRKGTCFNPGGGMSSLGKGRKKAGALPLDWGNIATLKAQGLKPKDLCLIPERLAIAAQEDDWYVRSIIIWSKKNPTPESVKDRPTDTHEYILMLTKAAKYYYNAQAVRERQTGGAHKMRTVWKSHVSIQRPSLRRFP